MAEAKAIFADNDKLVDDLVKEKLIQSPNIEHVFRVVDRGDYFLPDHKENAYKRSAWKSGAFHLSSPGIYSMVMENLRLAPGLSFLNIGSGTGYLSTMAGLILGILGVNHGVEIFADVKDYAEQNLRELKTKIPGLSYPQFCEPIFVKGNGLCLPKEINKYNRVYCGAECPENFVEYMKNLIKVDGILVMPVNSQLLQITRVSETLWEQKTISRVSFSPLQLPTLQDHLIPLKLPNFSSLHVASGSSDQLKPTVQHGSEINNMMNSSQEDTKLCPSLPSGKDEGNTVKKVVVEEIDSPAQSQSELLEDLRKITGRLHELLECPICFGTMDSSLIQCKNGHGICSTCVKSIEKCPTCKQDLVVYQSTLFGKILESLPKLCHYFDVGCSVILIDNDHETYCKFRPSSCKNTQCDWSGNVKDLFGHVKTCVKNKTGSGKQQKISSFFISSQTVQNNEKKEGQTTDFVEQKHPCDEACNRSPGKTLCTQCLTKFSTSNSGVCSQCNIVENNYQLNEEERFLLVTKPSQIKSPHKTSGSSSKTNILSSPDIILATPPVKNKHNQKNKVKPVKRKCSFENDIDLKRKYHSGQIEKETEFMPNLNSNSPNKSTKENISCGTQKTKAVSINKSINPFCKSSMKEVSHSGDDKVNVEKECVDNKKTGKSVEKIQTLNKKDLSNTNNCDLITLDHKFLDKKNGRNNIVDKNHVITKQLVSKNKNDFESAPNVNTAVTVDQSNEDVSQLVSSIENKHTLTPNSDSHFEDDIDHIFDDAPFFENEPIRLDRITRCKVVTVEHLKACGEIVLNLTPCNALVANTVPCVLRGSWVNSSISEGDIVSVVAKPLEGQQGCWVVDNESGLLVIHPDTLISGTTVVGSLFCMRRSVLSDMYRGIDSDSSIMVIGCFLHQLLQEVLKRKVSTLEDIRKVLHEFTKSRYFIFNLYSSSMSLDKTIETLKEFVPKIHGFVQKYVSTKSLNSVTSIWNEQSSWNGSIEDIADIEENIWSPSLGLKGKIDVTVKTSTTNYKEKVMPLELKTGRASFSAEHRGQVILYTMMMSELGKNVDSGLLLYLREGVMKEVSVGSVERRDLMLLRNELVTQLKTSHRVVVTNSRQIEAPSLPPPIHHHSACGKCPYLTLCSAALRLDGCSGVSKENPLMQLSESSTSHLQMCHIVYVFHWTGLLRLEHTEVLLNSPSLHHIWTMPPADRAKRGTCVPKVKLVERVVEVVAGSYQHIFQCDSGTVGSLTEGDYLIVSSASRPAVAAGPLTQLSQTQLTLTLERDLSSHQTAENVWYLDKYESQSGVVFNMTNLGCLLDCTEQANRLRKAVIDLELPEFSPKLSSRVLKASVDLLSELNDQQRKAIFRALAADHYILIKGMPGTGKTATIAALVQLAVRLGRSVLLTSHTHSAVDNMLLRLRGKVDFLRLGSAHKLHPDLTQYGEAGLEFTSPDDLHAFYSSKNVVGVTCLGSSHSLLTRRKFDLCIVDEATQVLQPTVLRPLFSAHKFILIGDPNQLPPLVRSSKAKELGLGESLFARLDRPAVTTELSLQYRMNQTITDLANRLTYGGRLQCGTTQVASATLSLPQAALDGEPAWVCAALSHTLAEAVVVLDTGRVSEAATCVNMREANIVLRILATLAKGLSDDRVGVIAPYRAQVDYLRQQAKSVDSLAEINTVDQYQGRDKDVIIYSCTRSAKPTESDILGDKNRLTVAITRARHKLIIVGNVTLLRGYPIFDQLFNSLPSNCILSIS